MLRSLPPEYDTFMTRQKLLKYSDLDRKTPMIAELGIFLALPCELFCARVVTLMSYIPSRMKC